MEAYIWQLSFCFKYPVVIITDVVVGATTQGTKVQSLMDSWGPLVCPSSGKRKTIMFWVLLDQRTPQGV